MWYAPDQSYRKKGAEMVRALRHARGDEHRDLASRAPDRRGGAALLSGAAARRAAAIASVIHPPLDNFPGESAVEDAERFNHLIEAQVRRVPEQYLWIHRRFKGVTEDYPDYYARSGRRAAG